MTRSIIFLVNLALFLASLSTSARSFEVMAPVLAPRCPAHYSNSLPTVGGKEATAPFGDLYCVFSDGEWSKEKSEILHRIGEAAQNLGTIASVSISANYFDGALVSTWLCSLNRNSGTSLTLYVQKSATSMLSTDAHVTGRFLDVVDDCFNEIELKLIGCDVHEGEKQCQRNFTNSHHMKGIQIVAQHGIVYAFGSGNFTQSSMMRNVEHWLIGISQQPIEQFDCLFDFAATLAKNPGMKFSQQRSIYNGCIALAKETKDIRVIPLPFNEREFKAEISRLASTSETIVVVGQFIESKWLFDLLRQNPSLQATFIVDSSYYYAFTSSSGREYNFISHRMAKNFFASLNANPNISVRFLMTNSNFLAHGQTNTVHARSILFDGEAPALLIGSAHWRDGAFANNTEQEIFLYGDVAISQRLFMDDLRARSVPMSDLPVENAEAIPALPE